MHHGHHFGPRAIDLAVDIALDEALALVTRYGLAVRAPFDEIGGGDERRRARARHDEVLRPLVAARAHVPVRIEHLVLREDAARGDQVLDERLARRELRHQPRRALAPVPATGAS